MEDGTTILYEVFRDGVNNGEFKVLSLGIEQIKRTCELWDLPITSYQIRRIHDRKVMWDGRLPDKLIDSSTSNITIEGRFI